MLVPKEIILIFAFPYFIHLSRKEQHEKSF